MNLIAMSSEDHYKSDPLNDPIVKKVLREKDMKIASLQMTSSAHQNSMSEMALRAHQAEEMLALMSHDWDMEKVAELIHKHFDQRGMERAVQQQAIIQTTLVSLNTALGTGDPETLKEAVNIVVKGLTQALGTMHDITTKEQNLTRSTNGTSARN